MGDVALRRGDGLDLAGLGKDDVGLGQVEVDRAARVAARAQDFVQRVHPLEFGEQIAVARFELRRARGEDRIHVGVGHPLLRADHRLVDLAVDEAAALVDLDVDGEREPLHARPQRADAVGEALRQHRDGAAGEVHGGPSLERFLVERAPLGHVMCDVGDVHAEEVVAVAEKPKLAHFDGVVEVLGRLAVDGDDVALAQIDAARQLLRLDLDRHALRGREHLGRKGVRDVMLADDHFDVDAGLADEAEDFDHAAAGVRRGAVGIAVELHVHHLAVARVHRGAGLDDDVGVDARIERRDPRLLLVVVKAADDGAVGAAENRRHFADVEVAVAHALDLRVLAVAADDDEVAIHRALHVAAVDVDVGTLAAAVDRAVAVGVHADAAGVVGRELEERVALAADRDDDAVALHLLDGAGDVVAGGVGIGEALGDLLDGEQAAAALAQQFGDALFEVGLLRDGHVSGSERTCRSTSAPALVWPRCGGAPAGSIRRIRSASSASATCCGACCGGRPAPSTPGSHFRGWPTWPPRCISLRRPRRLALG